MLDSQDLRLKRIYWRSNHRGCKETDIVLGQYAEKYLASLEISELSLFEQFIDEDDADIWGWLAGQLPAPDAYTALIETIRASRSA